MVKRFFRDHSRRDRGRQRYCGGRGKPGRRGQAQGTQAHVRSYEASQTILWSAHRIVRGRERPGPGDW